MTAAYHLPAARAVVDLVAQQVAQGRCVKLTVSSQSMAPFLQPGDVITVASSPVPLRLGDILVLNGGSHPWVHRLVRTRGAPGAVLLVTKGDNAARCDAAHSSACVMGCVAAVERDEWRLDLARGAARQAAPLLAVLSYAAHRAGGLEGAARRGAALRLLRLGLYVAAALVWVSGAARCTAAPAPRQKA